MRVTRMSRPGVVRGNDHNPGLASRRGESDDIRGPDEVSDRDRVEQDRIAGLLQMTEQVHGRGLLGLGTRGPVA